jgi:hypothetical protein
MAGILIFLLSNACLLFAQQEITIQKGDSLILQLGGYTAGEIQWQSSANKNTWNNVDSESANSSTLRYKPESPYYFRSEVTEEGCDPYFTDTLQVNLRHYLPDPLNSNHTKKSLNAGRAYIEPYTPGNSGIRTNESGNLSSWKDTSKKAVWYLYQRPGIYELNFVLNLTKNQSRNFKITCYPAYVGLELDTIVKEFSYTGVGRRDTLKALRVGILDTGYYRYELESKTNAGTITLYDLLFSTIATPVRKAAVEAPHTADYLSSPSVHLNFRSTASTTRQYDWIYAEIMVPSGGVSPLYTYWEALGFFQGYMGIQTNSETERRVLFSVWDATDREQYPDAGDELFVKLVNKATYTTANGFGGEGTGGQSYVGAGRADTWVEDKPVKFLMNIRQETVTPYENGKNLLTILVSAWYQAHEEEGWRYVATWRQPVITSGTSKVFDGFYAFIENYSPDNGQMVRKGYYYNAFGRETSTNQWKHLNKVSFSNTDGNVGQRVDFEQGVAPESPDKFYMLSGGYGRTKKTGTELPLITNFPPLENLDLTPFSEDVDNALIAEEERTK